MGVILEPGTKVKLSERGKQLFPKAAEDYDEFTIKSYTPLFDWYAMVETYSDDGIEIEFLFEPDEIEVVE